MVNIRWDGLYIYVCIYIYASNPIGWAILRPENSKEQRERRKTMAEKNKDKIEKATLKHEKSPPFRWGCFMAILTIQTNICPPSGVRAIYIYVYWQTRPPETEIKSTDMAQTVFGESAKGLCGHRNKRFVALAQHGVARAQTLFAQAQVTLGRLLASRPKRPFAPRKATFNGLC